MHYTKPEVDRLWPAYLMRCGPFWPEWYFQMRMPVHGNEEVRVAS